MNSLRARLSNFGLLCLVAFALSACGMLQPYQAELGQGNVVRPEQIDQLIIGQTPEQVTFILGSPLLTGEQTQVRWVYPIYDSATGFSNLIIYFSAGRVANIEQN